MGIVAAEAMDAMELAELGVGSGDGERSPRGVDGAVTAGGL